MMFLYEEGPCSVPEDSVEFKHTRWFSAELSKNKLKQNPQGHQGVRLCFNFRPANLRFGWLRPH